MEEQYLKDLCDRFQSLLKECPKEFYELAFSVRRAMGDIAAGRIDKHSRRESPFPAMWVSFKFATFVISENHNWLKETNAVRKKRATDAIKLLSRLEDILLGQVGRWGEDGHYQDPYPLYLDGPEDLSNLQRIKERQEMILKELQYNPLKHYHVGFLDRICGQAVAISEHYGLGKSSSKTPKEKGVEDDFSPIERMVQAILPDEDCQRIKSAIEAARKRLDREMPEEVYLVSEHQERLKAKRYGQK